MSTMPLDPNVQKFVTNVWTVSGETVKAFDVRHSRFPGANPTPVLLLERLEQFKDDPHSRKLALTLDEAMIDYAREWSGEVIFEVCAIGEKNAVLHTKRIKKKGEARDDVGQSPAQFSTNEKEMIAKLLEENRALTKMVVESSQYNRATDFRERERLIELSTGALEAQIQFAAGVQNLLNQDQERKLKLRSALRIDAAQEKAMQAGFRFVPAILERLTKGTMFEGAGKDIGLAPHLKTILEGLEKDPERAMMLFGILKEVDGGKPAGALLQIMESFDEDKKEADEAKGNAESEIKVTEKKKPADAAAPANGAGIG